MFKLVKFNTWQAEHKENPIRELVLCERVSVWVKTEKASYRKDLETGDWVEISKAGQKERKEVEIEDDIKDAAYWAFCQG